MVIADKRHHKFESILQPFKKTKKFIHTLKNNLWETLIVAPWSYHKTITLRTLRLRKFISCHLIYSSKNENLLLTLKFAEFCVYKIYYFLFFIIILRINFFLNEILTEYYIYIITFNFLKIKTTKIIIILKFWILIKILKTNFIFEIWTRH